MCARSTYLAEALKSSVCKGGEREMLELDGDNPVLIKLMIQFFYEGDYEPTFVGAVDRSQVKAPFPHSCNSTFLLFCSGSCPKPLICPHHCCGVTCRYTCKGFVCDICVPLSNAVKGGPDQLLLHAKMYEHALKHGDMSLKIVAAWKFELACEKFWNDRAFGTAAAYIFARIPDEDQLRGTVCGTITKHMSLLSKPEIESLVSKSPDLAVALLKINAAK
ncbi:hypothetical protein K491DRAFT_678692 [Lophiostoma macrostomum CBS 122681]|uniref:BTB domain-containing protein n=1 Tax=Lophiostoma macrostomum CBS 122681 TaxID=1314788 RepID=A0A6A6T707_9PLEO|nr:hypothetical protein K491DRAFT_678692 [Lophiostoma macrostomum CBS 122681]